jgi:SpoVK/Ycf46/Vps4 family AAA+-type ATPase
VLGEWGFDRKLSLGKGLNALFAGPSGTGKTMAAEVIADDLGLDLYKIDLSTVVSKYVGETEKNLERIFRAARNSNAILFFDEADALFGKRSEVRDAHDRYANVEISYLLQKMEEYDGLVVLTSNLSKNMDEAFMRRMHFTVEFPYPEEDARRRIWEIVLPDEAPLAPDIDFGLLAERYRLTGGNIRNVALTAAFLAARDSEVIGMDHLLWATRREFQKMGRLAAGREFVMESSDD